MTLFDQLGAALQYMGHGNCAWEGALTKAEIREAGEKNGRDLHELALQYSWAEIASATHSFGKSRTLGSGASGTVYRGRLREGTEVAVKVIEVPVYGSFEEEVRLLSRCRHPNVVMLLGFAREECHLAPPSYSSRATPRQRRVLVYELLHGGDLYSRLQLRGTQFPWQERLRTAIDVSRGLAHLHKHRPEIFHRDIKSQNILFGADGTAKIADFGLACVPARRTGSGRSDVAGTIGYVDPLYAMTGVVTEASEVYSWGMVLLELLTRRPPATVAADRRGYTFLTDELRPHEDHAKHRVLQRLDSVAQWPLSTAAGLATLALLCIHHDAERRPSFLEVPPLLQEMATVGSDVPPSATSSVGGNWAHLPGLEKLQDQANAHSPTPGAIAPGSPVLVATHLCVSPVQAVYVVGHKGMCGVQAPCRQVPDKRNDLVRSISAPNAFVARWRVDEARNARIRCAGTSQ